MRTSLPRQLLFGALLCSLLAGTLARAATQECEPADHPPDPDSSFDRTRTTKLSDTIGSYGFDLPGAIYSLAVSPDGSRVLAGGSSRTAVLWHVKAGRALRESPVGDRDVTAVAFSPDGRQGLIGFGLSGSEGYQVHIWDLITGNRIRAFDGHGWDVTSVSFSHDGKLVLSSGRDGEVKLWNPTDGKNVKIFDHNWQVLAATFSPDDQLVLAATRDGRLHLWDVATEELIRSFDGMHGQVRSIAFSEDGKQVLAVRDDGFILEWDTATGKATQTLAISAGGPTPEFPASLAHVTDSTDFTRLPGLHVALSSNGEHVIAALADGTLMTWNMKTLRLEDPQQSPTKTEFSAGRVALSPDGDVAAQGFSNGRVRLRNLEAHADISTGQHVDGGMEKLVVAPNGQRFFAVNATTRHLMLLDEEGKVLQDYPAPGEGRFGPNEKVALITQVNPSSHQAALRLIDTATGSAVHTLGEPTYITAFAFTRDGRQVLTVTAPEPPGEAQKSYVSLWDPKNGRKSQEVAVPFFGPTLFLPGLKQALTTLPGDGGMVRWELSSGKVLRTIARGVAGLRALAISPDGAFVATTMNSDKIVNLWSLETGDVLRSLKGHRCPVHTATFSTDGKRLLTIGGPDEELRLWDGATNEQTDAIDLTTHGDHAVSATFSSDGQSFLIGTERGLIMRYDFDTAHASSD